MRRVSVRTFVKSRPRGSLGQTENYRDNAVICISDNNFKTAQQEKLERSCG